MTVEFSVDHDTGGLEWTWKDDSQLSDQQAMIIAVAKLKQGLSEIAKGLDSVAAAISEVAIEIKHRSD